MPKVNHHRAGLLMAQHKEFESSNLTAIEYPLGTRYCSTGWGREAVPEGARYVIRSYATPIAWLDKYGGAHILAQTFSVSTSQHQSIVRAYFGHASDCSAHKRALADKANQERRDEEARLRAQHQKQRAAEYRERRRRLAREERERVLLVAQMAADEDAAKQSIIEAIGASA